ncbi:hypothetical protein QBC44DRAFT_313326 [Cladorrhinum sp. PSN332]|nr:hypothetical protein QBC44DRAFT_313326 [Cladorrhinum sp. PSN332]
MPSRHYTLRGRFFVLLTDITGNPQILAQRQARRDYVLNMWQSVFPDIGRVEVSQKWQNSIYHVLCREFHGYGWDHVSVDYWEFRIDHAIWMNGFGKNGAPFPFYSNRGQESDQKDWRFDGKHCEIYKGYLSANKVTAGDLENAAEQHKVNKEEEQAKELGVIGIRKKLGLDLFGYGKPIASGTGGDQAKLRLLWETVYGADTKPPFEGVGFFEIPVPAGLEVFAGGPELKKLASLIHPGIRVLAKAMDVDLGGAFSKIKLALVFVDRSPWREGLLEAFLRFWLMLLEWSSYSSQVGQYAFPIDPNTVQSLYIFLIEAQESFKEMYGRKALPLMQEVEQNWNFLQKVALGEDLTSDLEVDAGKQEKEEDEDTATEAAPKDIVAVEEEAEKEAEEKDGDLEILHAMSKLDLEENGKEDKEDKEEDKEEDLDAAPRVTLLHNLTFDRIL